MQRHRPCSRQQQARGRSRAVNAAATFWVDATEGRRYVLFAETFEQKVKWLRAIGRALGRDYDVPYERLDERFKPSRDAPDAPLAWRHVAEAAKLLQSGEAAAAQVALERVLALSPSDGADDSCACYARYELGRQLSSRGALREALLHLRKAYGVETAKPWTQLRLQLAWCCGLAGERDEAVRVYETVLEDHLLCVPAFLDRGKMMIRSHSWEAALGDLLHVAALGSKQHSSSSSSTAAQQHSSTAAAPPPHSHPPPSSHRQGRCERGQ